MRGGATIVVEGVRWRLRPDLDAAVWGARLGVVLRRIRRGAVTNLKSGRRKRMYALALDDAAGADQHGDGVRGRCDPAEPGRRSAGYLLASM